MKKIWKFFLLFILILVIGFSAFRAFFAPANNKKISSAEVKKGTLAKNLTISGKIEAEEKATLTFQTSGRVAWVGVKEGDYVKKYQTIASLDQRELRKKLDRYLNDYIKYRYDFDQITRDDYKDQVITDKIKRIWQKSQADLNKTVIDVELQTLAIEYSNLWSPIEGIVTQVTSPYPGADTTLANPAKFEIVNPKSIYFSATADQSEVKDLYQGMDGELVLDAYPEETIKGSIQQIGFTPKEDESGTVYEIKFVFVNDNTNYKYRLGMTGDLTMSIAKKDDVLYLPLIFVKEENNKKFVRVKRNGGMEKVYVETGLETDEFIEIVSGVSEGEIVYD